MSTYTQIYYHIVFSTKNRDPALTSDRRPDLFRYIWGIVKKRRSRLYRINGTLDHVHMLSSLHQSCSLADFVRDIKAGSSYWIKEDRVFPGFSNWQAGYGAFTHGMSDRDILIEYIKNQEAHHRTESFADELRRLLVEAGIELEERYLL
ncbi:MAG: IS200/IS605 family transposase [Deltaproteobacteria bacterium]|nr:IS200/IS605 family transposase [Deltaproteobacteria bacterium]